MPSLLPGYQYDVFISYRQKDNKYDGWVTEFVDNLKRELEATFKDEVTVYFDQNPHDGLHDSHHVDDSLKEKIKSLIFIPIISQTYCDPKAFAWQKEFLAFRDFAATDKLGSRIKVAGGNVINRILPIRIHEIDEEDRRLFEKETGGTLRAIDFTFSASGVNRPLSPNDNSSNNSNKAHYRDQISKVAQSIKQIISGLRNQGPEQKAAVIGGEIESKVSHVAQGKRSRGWLLASAGIAAVVLVFYFFGRNFTMSNPAETGAKKIAVLPFVNLSGNPDNEYFSDGITGDIITHISKVSDLKVISRSSVMRYKGTDKDIVEIGNELGVGLILEGTVRLSGDRARINANLINAVSREQVWADSYDKEIKDLFTLQAEVAEDIVTTLKANFSKPNGRPIPTSNLEAYDLYLKASYNFNKATKEGYRQAMEFSKRAVELDNKFALAYAMLADAYSLIVYYQFDDIVPLDIARTESTKAARISIELDPSLSEGYSALSYALRTHLWQWDESEKQILKGLAINPDNIPLRRRYALLLSLEGRFEESINESEKAQELDPLGSIYNADIARIYYYAGRVKEAMELAQYAFQVEPDYRPAMGMMAISLERSGLLDSSVIWVSRSQTRTGTDYEGVPQMFETKPAPYKEFWKKVLDQSLIDIKTKHISSMAMAVICMRNGMRDRALDFLEKGYDQKDGNMVYVNVEPIFDPLHGHARYEKIIDGMNLPRNGDSH